MTFRSRSSRMITADQIAHAMELLTSGVMPWCVKSQTGVGLDDIESAEEHGFDLYPPSGGRTKKGNEK